MQKFNAIFHELIKYKMLQLYIILNSSTY